MPKPVPIGARAAVEEQVRFEHTLTFHHPELPPVYSTPDMIRLMETACFLALHPYHEGDEVNVGTAIHVEHRAATGVGAQVTAEAVLQEVVEGRFYVMRVTARDQAQEIGRGTVTRAFVSVGRFLGKVQARLHDRRE
jgi:predicted thioesterase